MTWLSRAGLFLLAFFYLFSTGFVPGLMAERVWQCLAWSGSFLMLYGIGRLVLPAFFCGTAWFMALALIGYLPPAADSMPFALFLAFLAVYCCLRTLPAQRRAGLFVSGICAGCSVWFRQEIGFYTALAVFSTLALCHDPALRKKGDQRRFISGVVLAALLPGAYFLWQAPFQAAFFDFVRHPLKAYPSYDFIPYPALTQNFELLVAGQITMGQFLALSEQTFFYYFTPAVLIFSILFLTAGWHRPRNGGPAAALLWPMALLTLLGVLFLSQARFRADPAHLVPAYLVSCLLFSYLLFCVHQRNKTLFLIPVLVAVAVFLAPGVWPKLEPMDTALFYWINGLPHFHWLDAFILLISDIRQEETGVVLIALFFYGLVFKKHSLWQSALVLVMTFVLVNIGVDQLQNFVGRPRPVMALESVRILGFESNAPGFPSFAAANAALLFFFIHFVTKKGLFFWSCLVIALGFFRVYQGVHYPGDILGGWVLGSAAAWAAFLAYRVVHRKLGLKMARGKQ